MGRIDILNVREDIDEQRRQIGIMGSRADYIRLLVNIDLKTHITQAILTSPRKTKHFLESRTNNTNDIIPRIDIRNIDEDILIGIDEQIKELKLIKEARNINIEIDNRSDYLRLLLDMDIMTNMIDVVAKINLK
jgi:type III secretion system FlhB-like substrate exporter